MINITCGKSSYNTTNVNQNATFEVSDEATLIEAFYAFVKATEFEGYSPVSWNHILKDIISDDLQNTEEDFSLLDFLEDSILNC